MNINKRRYGLPPVDPADGPKTKDELIYDYARILVDSLYVQLGEGTIDKHQLKAVLKALDKYFQ